MFGRKKRVQRDHQRYRRRLFLEQLEDRRMLAVDITSVASAHDDFRFIAGDGIPPLTNTYLAEVVDANRVEFSFGGRTVTDTNAADGWSAEFDMSQASQNTEVTVKAYGDSGSKTVSHDVNLLMVPDWMLASEVIYTAAPPSWESGYSFEVSISHYKKGFDTPDDWAFSLPGLSKPVFDLSRKWTGFEVLSHIAIASSFDGIISENNYQVQLLGTVLDYDVFDKRFDAKTSKTYDANATFPKVSVTGQVSVGGSVSLDFENNLELSSISGSIWIDPLVNVKIDIFDYFIPIPYILGGVHLGLDGEFTLATKNGHDHMVSFEPIWKSGELTVESFDFAPEMTIALSGTGSGKVGFGVIDVGMTVGGEWSQALLSHYESTTGWTHDAPGQLDLFGNVHFKSFWGLGPSSEKEIFRFHLNKWNFLTGGNSGLQNTGQNNFDTGKLTELDVSRVNGTNDLKVSVKYSNSGRPSKKQIVVFDGDQEQELVLESNSGSKDNGRYSTVVSNVAHKTRDVSVIFRDSEDDMHVLTKNVSPPEEIIENPSGPSVIVQPTSSGESGVKSKGVNPTLSNPSFEKIESRQYKFHVNYFDPDGESPLLHYIRIDGVREATLTLDYGQPWDGVYSYTTTLSDGYHDYQMTFVTPDAQIAQTSRKSGPKVLKQELDITFYYAGEGLASDDVTLEYRVDGGPLQRIRGTDLGNGGVSRKINPAPNQITVYAISNSGNHTFGQWGLKTETNFLVSTASGLNISVNDSRDFSVAAHWAFTPQPYNISGSITATAQRGCDPAGTTLRIDSQLHSAEISTDGNGNYALMNIPGGVPYTITPSHANCRFIPPLFSLRTLDENHVDFNFQSTNADNMPPEVALIESPPLYVEDSSTVQFLWSGTDNKTSNENLEFRYRTLGASNESWSDWSHESSLTATLPNGAYTFEVSVRDEANNEPREPASATFAISANPYLDFFSSIDQQVWLYQILVTVPENVTTAGNTIILRPQDFGLEHGEFVPVRLFTHDSANAVGTVDFAADQLGLASHFHKTRAGYELTLPTELKAGDSASYFLQWGQLVSIGWQPPVDIPPFENRNDPWLISHRLGQHLDSEGRLLRLRHDLAYQVPGYSATRDSTLWLETIDATGTVTDRHVIDFEKAVYSSESDPNDPNKVHYSGTSYGSFDIGNTFVETDGKLWLFWKKQKYTYDANSNVQSTTYSLMYQQYDKRTLMPLGQPVQQSFGADWYTSVTVGPNNEIWLLGNSFHSDGQQKDVFLSRYSDEGVLIEDHKTISSAHGYEGSLWSHSPLFTQDGRIWFFIEKNWSTRNNGRSRGQVYVKILSADGSVFKDETALSPEPAGDSLNQEDSRHMGYQPLENLDGKVWFNWGTNGQPGHHNYYTIFNPDGGVFTEDEKAGLVFNFRDSDGYIWGGNTNESESKTLWDPLGQVVETTGPTTMTPRHQLDRRAAHIDDRNYQIFDRWSRQAVTIPAMAHPGVSEIELIHVDTLYPDTRLHDLTIKLSDSTITEIAGSLPAVTRVPIAENLLLQQTTFEFTQSSLVGGQVLVTFGQETLGNRISGSVYNDANANGQFDHDDTVLPGWTVFVDENKNAEVELDEPTTITDSSGGFSFAYLATGEHSVRVIPRREWNSPLNESPAKTVAISDGSSTDPVEFRFVLPQTGRIGGHIYNDINGDGILNRADPGMSGIPVYLDYDNNNRIDLADYRTFTDERGHYEFPAIPVDQQIVRANAPNAVSQLFGDIDLIAVVDLQAGSPSVELNTPWFQPIDIRGIVFNDNQNGDGLRDHSEPGLESMEVIIGRKQTGFEETITTDENGEFAFPGIGPGTYQICVSPADGFQATTDECLLVRAQSGQDANLVYGIWDAHPRLFLQLRESHIFENSQHTGTFTIRREDPTEAVNVSFSSSSNRISLSHTSYLFSAGQTYADIPFTVEDDNAVTGDVEVEFIVNAQNHQDGSDKLFIVDHEQLSIELADHHLAEGQSMVATIHRTNTDGDLSVDVTTSDSDAITVPSFVVIPDGQLSLSFDVAAVINAIDIDIDTFHLTVQAEGYHSAHAALTLHDHETGVIRGNVWDDRNGSSASDDYLSGVACWTVFIDTNDNLTLDGSEPSVVTDLNGDFEFTHVASGDHRVMVNLPDGIELTSPLPLLSDDLTTTVDDFQSVQGTDPAVSPDGRHLYIPKYTVDKSKILLFDRNPTTGEITYKSDLGYFSGQPEKRQSRGYWRVIVSQDGNHVYALPKEAGGMILKWNRDQQTGMFTGDLEKYTNAINDPDDIQLTPDGTSLLTAPFAQLRRDPVSGALSELRTYPIIDDASAIAISPSSGDHAYVVGNKQIGLFSKDKDGWYQYDSTLAINDVATSIVISPSGLDVYVGSSQLNTIYAYKRSPATGQLTLQNQYTNVAGVKSLTLTPDGRHLFATAPTVNRIAAYHRDPVSGQLTLIRTIAGQNAPYFGAASPDNRHLYFPDWGDDGRTLVVTRDIGQPTPFNVSVTPGIMLENTNLGIKHTQADNTVAHHFYAADTTASGTEDSVIRISRNELLSLVDLDDTSGLVFEVDLLPESGTASIDSTGDLIYVPDGDFAGEDLLTYFARSECDRSNSASITFSVDPLNDLPITSSAEFFTLSNQSLEKSHLDGLMRSSDDIDNDILTYSLVTEAANGDIQVFADGAFQYRPQRDFIGTDEFTFKVNDGLADSNTSSVQITVSEPSIQTAISGVVFFDEDSDQVQNQDDGLGNVMVKLDLDNNGVTDQTTSTSQNGVFQFDDVPNGTHMISIQPPPNSEPTTPEKWTVTTESFSHYQDIDFGVFIHMLDNIDDIQINEDAGEQTVNLTGITARGNETQPLRVTATSSNISLVADPIVTYVSAEPAGTIKFQSLKDQHGKSTITVTVEDGGPDGKLETSVDNASSSRTFDVTVNPVNDDPTLDAISNLTIDEDAAEQAVSLSGIGAGGGESQPLRVTASSDNTGLISDPTVTYTSAEATGSIAFTPLSEQIGTAMITVTVEDGGLDGDLATASDNATTSRIFDVTVNPVNDDPTLDALSDVTIDEDTAQQTVTLTGISAGGGESQPLRVTTTSSKTSLIPHPAVTYTSAEATGTLKFTPILDQFGSTTITVTVEDGGFDGNLDTGNDNATFSRTVDVTVTPVNDAPVTSTGNYQPIENTMLTVTRGAGLSSLVTDVEDDSLAFSVVLQPLHGELVLNADGSFAYTPDLNFNRTDYFTYRAHDGKVNSDPGTAMLQIDTEYPWYNSKEPKDTNDNDQVTSIDALLIINSINADGIRQLSIDRSVGVVAPFMDVNRDGHLTPLDALLVIDHLNQFASSGLGEGEPFSLDDIVASQWADQQPAWIRSVRIQRDSSLLPASGTSSYQQAVDDTMRTLAWQPQPQLARSVDRREGELDDADELAELIDELAADTGSGELQQ